MLGKIRFGNQAIPFRVTDYLGNKVILKECYGKKILLSFFREASCPFCNMRVRELIHAYPEFQEKNIEIIVFFASTAEEIKKYAGNQNAPFVIVPDPEMKIYSMYDVHLSRMGMLKTMFMPIKMFKVMRSGFFNMKSIKTKPIVPSDFLIDEHQNIFRIYFGKDYGDHIPLSEILDWKKSGVE